MRITGEYYFWRVFGKALRQTLKKEEYLISEAEWKRRDISPLHVNVATKEDIVKFSKDSMFYFFEDEVFASIALEKIPSSVSLTDLEMKRLKGIKKYVTNEDVIEYTLEQICRIIFLSYFYPKKKKVVGS
jgi:hypothetical protein